MAHDEHHHEINTEPPGVADMVIGYVVFFGITHVVKLLCDTIDPEMLSSGALIEIQLSGLLFMFVWWLIGNGLFKPFFEAAFEREESTSGAQRKAQELRRATQDIEAKVSEELGKARLVGIQQRDAKVEMAKRRAQEKIDVAQQQNDKDIRAAAEQIGEMRAQAEQELSAEAEKLAELVSERALSVKSSSQSVH